MQRNTDRDASVERLLRTTLRTPAAPGNLLDACLEAETVAAWAEGALPQTNADLVEAHLSECARCQALLAAFARMAPQPVVAASYFERWHLRWLVPIAAAATTVAIWIAIPGDQRPPVPQESAAPLSTAAPPSATPVEPAAPAPGAVAEKRESMNEVAASESLRSAEQEADAATPADLRAERSASVAPGDETTAAPQALMESVSVGAASPPAASASAEQGAPSVLARRAVASPVEIVSPSADNRWRILDGTLIERSTTGGNTWEAAVMPAGGQLTAGSSPESLICWLVGTAGTVRITIDGVRFDAIPFPETVDLVGVRASSATTAVVTTTDGRQFRTDDRGASWNRVAP